MSAPILSTGGWKPPVTDGKAKRQQGLARRGLHGCSPTQHRLLPGVVSREKSEPLRQECCSNMRNKSGKVLCSGQRGFQTTGSLGKPGMGTDHSKSMKPSNSSSTNIRGNLGSQFYVARGSLVVRKRTQVSAGNVGLQELRPQVLEPARGKDRDLPVAEGHARPGTHLSGKGALRVLLIPSCIKEG